MTHLHPRVAPRAFITGASRGVGAQIALQMAQLGADIALNFREKSARAEKIAAQIAQLGQRATLAQADITDAAQLQNAFQTASEQLGAFDFLFLNASGGLEKNRAPDYAFQLNETAQLRALDTALPFLKQGARVVYVTSHLAHFYPEKSVPSVYEVVAQSKKAGETALRAQIPALAKRQISLVVVSGPAIEGTITPKLMQRATRENAENHSTLSVEKFAAAIVEAAQNRELASGATVLVGEAV